MPAAHLDYYMRVEDAILDTAKIAGLSIVIVGVIMFVFPFSITNVNPNVSLGFAGLMVVLLGVLILAANSFRKRVQLRGLWSMLAAAGWCVLTSGALISFAGFLLGSIAYVILDWIIVNGASMVLYIPVVTFAPWFVAGLAGSVISVLMLYLISSIKKEK